MNTEQIRRIRYDNNLLQEFIEKNSITILKDYSNEAINRDTIIEGTCKTVNCNEKFSKNFRRLYDNCGYYCNNCSKLITRTKTDNTNLLKYGFKCPLQNKMVKEKHEQTIFEKYGVINVSQIEVFQNKKIETSIKNYGVNNPSQSQIIKNKKIETCMKNYGVQHPLHSKIVIDKIKITCLETYGCESVLQDTNTKLKIKNRMIEKYGVENPSQCQTIQNKKIETNIAKYGFIHPSQNKEYMDNLSKNTYKLKDYILPSGNIIKIQGYENYAFDEILQQGILEEDIINGCKNVPEIWYEDESNKKHRHYVDIFIPMLNKCIEVKSTWTAEKKKDNIFFKQEAGKNAGYLYEIWVYNGKGEKVKCYK